MSFTQFIAYLLAAGQVNILSAELNSHIAHGLWRILLLAGKLSDLSDNLLQRQGPFFRNLMSRAAEYIQ